MTDLLRVPVQEHLALSTHVLTGLGVPETDAREQAELLLEGDLRGHASHGLRRLDMLAQRLRNGAVRASARPTRTWTTPSVLVVDGDGGLGPRRPGAPSRSCSTGSARPGSRSPRSATPTTSACWPRTSSRWPPPGSSASR